MQNTIPTDILKIQKKLGSFKKGSRNYNKYSKILKKHIKKHTMQRRISYHINTIEKMDKVKNFSKKENIEKTESI